MREGWGGLNIAVGLRRVVGEDLGGRCEKRREWVRSYFLWGVIFAIGHLDMHSIFCERRSQC